MTMQISEDGKYKWDGNEWIPIDAAPAPAAEATPISVAVSALGTSYSWMEADEVVTDECTGILEYTTANPILRIINSIALLFGFAGGAIFVARNPDNGRAIVGSDVRNV